MTLPIKDNRVIIIGHNGIGKSTILNALYYLVSAQWEKLREIYFDSLVVQTDSKTFTVKREQLLEMEFHRQRSLLGSHADTLLSSNLSRILPRLTSRELRELSATEMPVPRMRFIARKYGVPVFAMQELGSLLRRDNADFSERLPSEIKETEDFFDENLEGQILYLPTYRRIEKDIKSIFPEIEDEIQRAIRPRSIRGMRSQRDLYIELVNFGMEDVHRMIEEKMELLRHLALNEIRELSTRYLRDVIRNEGNEYDPKRVREINKDGLRRIFANADESLLSRQDQNKIDEVVEKIKAGKDIEENERYVAHYISSLIDISERIDEREKPVQEFVRICGSYLFEKQIKFDNANYSLKIEQGDEDSVEMEHLSSGEKQIVSLFAHMTLYDSPRNYVIIDEPELSLSVNWQKKFLQDISDLKSCAFVGAVTHSPFVFQNGLDKYAVDMFSCISR